MQALIDKLRSQGFKRRNGSYRLNGLGVNCELRWLTFVTAADQGDGLLDEAGRAPALWKRVQAADGRMQREFHVPLDPIVDREAWDEKTGEAVDPVAATIEWARATAHGELPPAWQAPPREDTERLLPKDVLTVQTGPCAVQGHLHCADQRLAIEYPLVRSVPADLSPARRAWLDVVVADAQNGCRLVRLVTRETDETTSNILVEVDLSGVPHFVMPELVRFAADAARHVVSRYVCVSELLVDPAVTSAVWDIPPEQVGPAEGGQ